VVCPRSDLQPGDRTIVEAGGLSVGVFNLDGEFYAINNVCPHQLAPLCEGDLTGLVTSEEVDAEQYQYERPGEILTCPWHNWEFDVKTGESVFNPHLKTRTYDVEVESPEELDDAEGEAGTEEGADCQECEYGTSLAGDEPPVETYDVEVEDEMVVLYV
jgi:nitrite reductase/ring-hydroxylating ferredoxin subunit